MSKKSTPATLSWSVGVVSSPLSYQLNRTDTMTRWNGSQAAEAAFLEDQALAFKEAAGEHRWV